MASPVESFIRSTVTKAEGAVAGVNRSLMANTGSNPFLTGIHEPMTGERTITDLKVTGAIPADLDGRYVRIGPNPASPQKAAYVAAKHGLVGLTKVTALETAEEPVTCNAMGATVAGNGPGDRR